MTMELLQRDIIAAKKTDLDYMICMVMFGNGPFRVMSLILIVMGTVAMMLNLRVAGLFGAARGMTGRSVVVADFA